MSGSIVAPQTRSLDDLARTLKDWMSGRMPGAVGLELANLDYPRGAGQSHETILFDARWVEDGQERTRGLVLRIKPSGFVIYPDDRFEQQFAIMQALHADGRVAVAKPYWFEADPGLLGAPFFVMEKKHGRVPVSIPPYGETGWVADASVSQRRRMWEEGVAQLAAIQTIPTSSVSFLAGPDGLSGFEQEWDMFARFVDWVIADTPSPALAAGLARLAQAFPANRPDGMVWGDARLGNMMFDEDFRVVAVMDWEQPSLGGALHDLAWFLTISRRMHGETNDGVALEGMGGRAETIARWEKLTGKSAAEIEWYEEFTELKMACLGLRMGFLRGKPMMDEAAVAKRLKVD